ncbi:5-formyltetrahydrofolate cyclo-ligase [Parvularcula maris]|uniref:5-formyltetrahydrofolate cyclo-ligase n=1 Tax=Parvularcula maris TaxID=2965077 RepID=A0A9X2LAZ8_9PROT|nr:5-formyltetrahydrofolate cyclo-ligase [Parvularcula maris]MCQ8186178.1 5-formyltetrahydrofolate cyclo-ligase [Parvularcula maris]
MLPPLPLIHWKKAFRERAKALRSDAAKRQPSAAKFAASYFMGALEPKEGQAVALYHPVGDELDTAHLAAALAEAGAAVLLPVVETKNAPLIFRLFEIDKPLVKGRYGIMEPSGEAERRRPDIVVTPLLAVRPDGARLGMGGGYYDRTLAALREEGEVTAIGYGYAAQMADRFPVGPEDQFLDGFVSEQGYKAFARRR